MKAVALKVLSAIGSVLDARWFRLCAAVGAAWFVHASASLVAGGRLSVAELVAVAFFGTYAGLRIPRQGIAAFAILPAFAAVSVLMLVRDISYFLISSGFGSADAIAWSLLYGPYPGMAYVLSDARILGTGNSVGWIQAALYVLALSLSDSVTRAKVAEVDLFMKVNYGSRTGIMECVLMGSLGIAVVELTRFGGLISLAAFVGMFLLTLKVPAVSGVISKASDLVRTAFSRPAEASPPKGATVADPEAATPAEVKKPEPPREGREEAVAPAVDMVKEVVGRAQSKRPLKIPSGSSKAKAMDLGSSEPDMEMAREEMEVTDEEVLYRSAASMMQVGLPVLMGFMADRLEPYLKDQSKVAEFRKDRALGLVVDALLASKGDVAAASSHYERALAVTPGGAPPARTAARTEALPGMPGPDADGFVGMDDGGFAFDAGEMGTPLAESDPSAAGGEEEWSRPEEAEGPAWPDDRPARAGDGYAGLLEDPEGGVDSILSASSFLSAEATEAVVSGDLGGQEGDSSVEDPGFAGFETMSAFLGAVGDAPDEEPWPDPDDVAPPDPGGAGIASPPSDGDLSEVGTLELVEVEAELAEMSSRAEQGVARTAPAPVSAAPARSPSDEMLLARAVPMSRADIEAVAQRKIKSVGRGSLETLAGDMVDMVLGAELGPVEDDVLDGMVARLPPEMEGLVQEASFFFGLVQCATGRSQPDKDQARDRIALILTRLHRESHLVSMEEVARRATAGEQVAETDLRDALSYVERILRIFPQPPGRASESDRYAVVKAALVQRLEADGARGGRSPALATGMELMLAVSAKKGRAALDSAPGKLKRLVRHVEGLKRHYEELLDLAASDAMESGSDFGAHRTSDAIAETLALAKMAFAEIQSQGEAVERIVRSVRPMGRQSEVMSDFVAIVGEGMPDFMALAAASERPLVREQIGSLERRAADAERRAAEFGGSPLQESRSRFAGAMADPVDAILRRVEDEESIPGEEIGSAAFPAFTALRLPSGMRVLMLRHGTREIRITGFLALHGMGATWRARTDSERGMLLSVEGSGMPPFCLADFVAANAVHLAESGIADLKVLLFSGTLERESADASVRSLGRADDWDSDGTGIASSAGKGNVLLMEDLASRWTEPAVKFGMAAKSGFQRRYAAILSSSGAR